MAGPLRVALVDDSRTALLQLSKVLAKIEGVEVVGTACDGVGSIRLAEEVKPDLLIMDIVMPGMDGLAALRLLHSRYPTLRVAMVSSIGGSASRAEEAFRLGAVQVVGKPYDPAQLEALIESEQATGAKREEPDA